MIAIQSHVVVVLLIWCAVASAADSPEVFGTAGLVKGYLDEPAMPAAGAGVQIPVWDRLGARAEFLMSNHRFYSKRYFLVSATYDYRDSRHAVVPYLIGGGGYVVEREKWIPYSSGSGAIVGGMGVRFTLGSRVTLAPEIRLGDPAFPLFTVNIGFRLRGRR